MDKVSLEILKNLFSSVAEEMGLTLRRTAYSPNIKERRDFSCAIFDDQGRLMAQAAHIPVHLGAMPMSVKAATSTFGKLDPGDVVMLNDPYMGGTHLPDITMVSPVYCRVDEEDVLAGYAASRAHHADVGGMAPGSMALATEIYQEGVIIPPIKIQERGKLNEAAMALIYRNVRTPGERKGDLAAQVAAHRVGELRLQEIVTRYGIEQTREAAEELMNYAERLTCTAIGQMPNGEFGFRDYMDGDGFVDEPVAIEATITIDGEELTCDFTGSAPEQLGPINAVQAVAQAAVYYVIRCLVDAKAPSNDGCFRPIKVVAPEGTVVNARFPRAVAAGNVETSQRIVDVVMGALAQAVPNKIPAAGQGTMNNVLIGGYDPYRGKYYTYYETIGGGMGAHRRGDGASAVHVHMSNTFNTPVEALEFNYPLRILEYSVREGSGGTGKRRGGDGIRRTYQFLSNANVSILSDRRFTVPYGLEGGASGQPGRNIRGIDGTDHILPSKVSYVAGIGETLTIETPGGGGWGKTEDAATSIEESPGVDESPSPSEDVSPLSGRGLG